MKIFQRYLLVQIGAASLACVGLFVFVMLAANALRDVIGPFVSGRISFGFFLQLLGLLIPFVSAYALPLGLLTGILLVLGRMSAQREIVAMKTSGISLWRMSATILLLASLGVVFSMMVHFSFAPNARTQFREMLGEAVKTNPLEFVVPGTFVRDFQGAVIYSGERDRDSGEVRDLWIWELNEQRKVIRTLRAPRGIFSWDVEEDALILEVFDGFIETRNVDDPENLTDSQPGVVFESWPLRLPLDRLVKGSSGPKKLSNMNFGELWAEREKAAEMAREDPQYQNLWVRVNLEIQRNFAMSFACYSLILVGIPLGVRFRRGETYANIALALGLGLLYYFLMIVLSWLETAPHLRPDILIWIPNFLFQGAGLWLFYRVDHR